MIFGQCVCPPNPTCPTLPEAAASTTLGDLFPWLLVGGVVWYMMRKGKRTQPA